MSIWDFEVASRLDSQQDWLVCVTWEIQLVQGRENHKLGGNKPKAAKGLENNSRWRCQGGKQDRIWTRLKLLELGDHARGGKGHGSVPGADKATGENGPHLLAASVGLKDGEAG